MNSVERRRGLRAAVNSGKCIMVPGAFNALSARLIEDLGFEAVYLTGAGLTNMYFALPDMGFMGLHELAQHTALIRDAVDIPLIVDADTGFGNALNAYQAVKTLERAGADAIQLEDQVSPKRCGHFSGKEVIPADEMVGKIRAATDAREDRNVLIIARTDARSTESFEATIERAHRYSEAGADVLFVEALESVDEIRRAASLLTKPRIMNIVIGGKTPVLELEQLSEMGYGIALYANAALQGALAGMQKALQTLQSEGGLDEDPNLVTPFVERQRLARKPEFDSFERLYASQKPGSTRGSP